MGRIPKTQRIWNQPYKAGRTGMQVIEDVQTGTEPFGFARALAEDPPEADAYCEYELDCPDSEAQVDA